MNLIFSLQTTQLCVYNKLIGSHYPQTLEQLPDSGRRLEYCSEVRVMRFKNRLRVFQLLTDEEEVRWECTYCEEQFEEHEVSHDMTVYEDEESAEGFCPNCS